VGSNSLKACFFNLILARLEEIMRKEMVKGNRKGRTGNENDRTRNDSLPLTALISSIDLYMCQIFYKCYCYLMTLKLNLKTCN
jgi:hypothetical protein